MKKPSSRATKKPAAVMKKPSSTASSMSKPSASVSSASPDSEEVLAKLAEGDADELSITGRMIDIVRTIDVTIKVKHVSINEPRGCDKT